MINRDCFQLLMEETGCDRSEAELALSIANNDFEKAVTMLGLMLKHIIAFKIKILFLKENIYALMHIAIDIKISKIVRFSVTFSHNPSIYEVSINANWFSYEKAIFSARLNSGVMEQYTKETEKNLKIYIQKALKELIVILPEDISYIIKNFFHPVNVSIEIINEELNLAQFKKLPDYNLKQNLIPPPNYDLGFIKLDVKILEDNLGKPVKKITEGETLLSIITDERDLSHYIAHLIGGTEKDGKMQLIPASVKKIIHRNNDFEIFFEYAPSIVGVANIKSNVKVKTLKPKQQPWWKKMLPW